MNRHGFTLLELSISMAMLSIISLLAFYAVANSTESAVIAQSKGELQGNLRDTMDALIDDLSVAFTDRIWKGGPQTLPLGLTGPLTVSADGTSVTFQRPVPKNVGIPDASTPIIIRFENEDLGGTVANGVLDSGEDVNGDGSLTRRMVRVQDGALLPLGSANNISRVKFELLANQDTTNTQMTSLRIELEATKVFSERSSGDKLVRGVLATTIHLNN